MNRTGAMAVPREFCMLVGALNDLSGGGPLDEIVWIADSISKVDPDVRIGAKTFLKDSLDRGLSSAELQEIWHSCNPDYILSDRDLQTLFELLLTHLGD